MNVHATFEYIVLNKTKSMIITRGAMIVLSKSKRQGSVFSYFKTVDY